MSEICETCGLPKEICQCKEEERKQQDIHVYQEKRRYGKLVTIIEGMPSDQIGEIATQLKTLCACGGTVKDGNIELQGDHKKKVTEKLQQMGFRI